MEQRDSSTSVTSVDEEAMISITAGLAKEASLLFHSRRFTECIHVLNRLLKKKQDDPKVLHNIAVAEYSRDGCSDPKKLLDALNKVKKRSEELSHAAREQVEGGSNNIIAGSKGSGATLHQLSDANGTRIAFSDEFDPSIATLNIAVVLFHLHEYAKALSLLEPLYQNIEPIDETTALHICLLFLDVALASNDAIRAADAIQYLERAIGVGYMFGQGENVSSSQHQTVKASPAPSNLTAPDKSNLESTAGSANPTESLSRTLSEAYEELLSTLDIGGQSLSRPIDLPLSTDLSRITADRPAPAVDLKLKLHLYKVRFLLLTKNLKAAKREVKLAMNVARGIDSSTALLLKSQLEFSRGNHRKAVKLLMTSSNRTESVMPGLVSNNFGCINHQLRKHNISAVLFSKALRSSSALRSEKPLKLSSFSQDKSLLIVYNCGLQYLACGKPLVAARCFLKASSVFYDRPLLWLRIAECCLSALEKGLLRSSAAAPTDQQVKVHVIGQGKWRQVAVEDAPTRGRNLDSLEQDDKSLGGDGQTKLSASYARQCLLNALHLLNVVELKSSKLGLSCARDESNQPTSLKSWNHKNFPNGDAKDPKGGVSSNTTLLGSISTYNDICRRENQIIKQAVLANLSYWELNLENPLKALWAAKSLLMLPECTRFYTFFGHLYAAEALCILNRPREAAEHLSVYVVADNVELPYNENDTENWRVVKSGEYEEPNGGSVGVKNVSCEECQNITFLRPEEAQGTLYANLATMFVMQGDVEQAHRFAKKALSLLPKNRQAVLMSVYLDLLLGNSQDALVKLKQCSSVRFVSTISS